MHALRISQQVSGDGYLHIAVPPEMGRLCEVIILPLDESSGDDSTPYNRMKMQEQTGFVQQVLTASSEDVWNDV